MAAWRVPQQPQQSQQSQQHRPTTQAKEAWLIIGRRGGKSFMMALIAVFLACFRDYRPHLAPGERALVPTGIAPM